MITVQIYYFSRSGRSQEIADRLAKRYETHPLRIDDGKNWAGGIGFLKAAYMAVSRKSLPIRYQKPVDGEQIVLVFPVWADSFPPAIRTFLSEIGRERIICIPTSNSSKLKDRTGFIKVIDLVGNLITEPEEL